MSFSHPHDTLEASPSRRPHGRPWPLHVMLLPMFPALAVWSANADQLRSLFPLRLAVGCSLVALVTLGIVTVVQRDLRRGALFASVVTVVALTQGYVLTDPTQAPRNLAVFGVIAAMMAILVTKLPQDTIRWATVLLNVMAVALVAANGARVTMNRPPTIDLAVPLSVEGEAPEGVRSVWYLVPDRFPSQATLQELGFEVDAFFDGLEERGFQVVDDARANYPDTALSLASAWNLDHVDPTSPGAYGRAVGQLADPVMGRVLSDAGLVYRHLGSWASFTADSRSADQVLTLQGANEFWSAWEPTTVVPTLRYLADAENLETVRHRRQIEHGQHQFRILADLAAQEPARAEFVLAHLIVPHSPYVFAADGTISVHADATPAQARAGYAQQLAYVEAQLLELVDHLQARQDPPIIVLLSDEGLYPGSLAGTHVGIQEGDEDPTSFTPEELVQKFSILAAVYDPTGGIGSLPPTTSSVNITRTVVDAALGTDDLPPLPDTSYQWTDARKLSLSPLPSRILQPR